MKKTGNAIEYRYKHLMALLASGEISNTESFVQNVAREFNLDCPELSYDDFMELDASGRICDNGTEYAKFIIDGSILMVVAKEGNANIRVIQPLDSAMQRDGNIIDSKRQAISDILTRMVKSDIVQLDPLGMDEKSLAMVREFDKVYGDNGLALREEMGNTDDIWTAFSHEIMLATRGVYTPHISIIEIKKPNTIRRERES